MAAARVAETILKSVLAAVVEADMVDEDAVSKWFKDDGSKIKDRR